MIILEKANKNGFTIIELIVVIAIIAVLSTIISYNINQYLEKAKIVTAKAEVAQIVKAMVLYRSKYGCLPSTGGCNVDYNSYWSQANWHAQWDALANLLISDGDMGFSNGAFDDPWGNPYVFDKNDYVGYCSPVWSLGPDGIDQSSWSSSNYNCPKTFLGDDIGLSLSVK